MADLDLQTLWQQQPTDDLVRLDPGRAPADALALAEPLVRPPAHRPWVVLFVVLAVVLLLGAGRVPAVAQFVGLVGFLGFAGFLGVRRALHPTALASAAVAMSAILSMGAVTVERHAAPRELRIDEVAVARCLSNTHAEAAAACKDVLAQAPSHLAAKTRLALITMCNALRERADALERGGNAGGALTTLELISDECAPQFVEAMTRVEPLSREAERQCAALARDGRWEDARPACEAAARVRCQVGDEFTSTEPTLGAGLSWPRVMAAVERAPFVCPAVPLLKRGARPRPRAQRQLELRAPALEVYVRGDLATARKLALGPPEDPALSDFLAGVERVENEFNTAVVNDDVVAQQRAVRDLLARELRFLPKGTVSRFSDRLRHQLTHAAYERGKDLADRKDWRAACRFWKEGLTFGRDDVDLLKAVTNVCTMRAHDVLRTADSCEALKGGLDFAVDGDGQRELLEGELDRHGCR